MKFSFQKEVLIEDYCCNVYKGKKYFTRYRKDLIEKNDLECDYEFFKKFFKGKSEEVTSIVVETDNKEIWIWTKPVEKNGRKAGGWEFVKKIKD